MKSILFFALASFFQASTSIADCNLKIVQAIYRVQDSYGNILHTRVDLWDELSAVFKAKGWRIVDEKEKADAAISLLMLCRPDRIAWIFPTSKSHCTVAYRSNFMGQKNKRFIYADLEEALKKNHEYLASQTAACPSRR